MNYVVRDMTALHASKNNVSGAIDFFEDAITAFIFARGLATRYRKISVYQRQAEISRRGTALVEDSGLVGRGGGWYSLIEYVDGIASVPKNWTLS